MRRAALLLDLCAPAGPVRLRPSGFPTLRLLSRGTFPTPAEKTLGAASRAGRVQLFGDRAPPCSSVTRLRQHPYVPRNGSGYRRGVGVLGVTKARQTQEQRTDETQGRGSNYRLWDGFWGRPISADAQRRCIRHAPASGRVVENDEPRHATQRAAVVRRHNHRVAVQ
jgi:hypothetical protein